MSHDAGSGAAGRHTAGKPALFFFFVFFRFPVLMPVVDNDIIKNTSYGNEVLPYDMTPHTKTMLARRKSLPGSNRQLDTHKSPNNRK